MLFSKLNGSWPRFNAIKEELSITISLWELLYSVSCRHHGLAALPCGMGSADLSVVLPDDGTQDDEKSTESNQVDGRTALAWIF